MVNALTGARIVNTRATHQAAGLDAALLARGARPISFPCIAIAAPANPASFIEAVHALTAGSCGWLVFTSANAVLAVAEAIGPDAVPASVRVAALGPGTAQAAVDLLKIEATVVSPVHSATGLAASLPVRAGERVFLPSSSIARTELAAELRSRGALVDVVTAYRTTVGSGGADLSPLFANGLIDAIAFASPSAVDGFQTRVVASGFSVGDVASLPVACIGPTTADRADALGFTSISIAAQQTVSGLIDSLETALASTRKGAAQCR